MSRRAINAYKVSGVCEVIYKLQCLLYAPANVQCVCLGMCWCLLVSHLYGFGLLDAESMVKEAERWKQVPSQHECAEEAAIQLSRYQRSLLRLRAFLDSSPFIVRYLFLSLFWN